MCMHTTKHFSARFVSLSWFHGEYEGVEQKKKESAREKKALTERERMHEMRESTYFKEKRKLNLWSRKWVCIERYLKSVEEKN